MDLDRVEMILPQVHLRNGETHAESSNLDIFNAVCVYPSATIIRTPARLSRGAFPQPSFLSHSSAFAGVGLNIKQALGVLKKVTHKTHPIPYSL